MSMNQPKGRNTAAAVKDYSITRLIDAPVGKVWRAWSDPELFKKWWGPKGYTSNSAKMDFRVGGRYLWNMHSPEGKDFYSAGVYKEIVPMKKIVFTDSFSDEQGKAIPASQYNMPGNWPLELTTTITMEERDGKTRLTWEEPGVPEESIADALQGGKETLDKLEEVSMKG
jgi:uncharacterized protein YndB with AHSA1/START domain